MPADSTDTHTGHCLCGACRFTLTGRPNWVGHCHCESCRRATASPMTTWVGQPDGAWAFTAGTPATYASSRGTTRGFCPSCGSPLFYRSDNVPGETHFYAALLAEPDRVTPTAHYHYGERLAWLHLPDDLPRK